MLSVVKILGNNMRSGYCPSLKPLIFYRSNQYLAHYSHRQPLLICQQFLYTTNNKHVTLSIPNTLLKHVKCNQRFGLLNFRPKYLYSTKTIEPTFKKVSEVQKKTRFRLMSGGEFGKVIQLAKPEKWRIAGGVLLLLVSSTVTMSVPIALGKVIDIIYDADTGHMRENLNIICAALLAVFIVGGLCNFGRVYLMNISAQRITKTLREKVFNSILKQEVAYFDRAKTGELINRLSADTSLVSSTLTTNVSDGLRSTIMVSVGMFMMFYMSPSLALVSLCVVPPVAGMAIVYGRFVKKLTTKVQDSLADATQVAEERIANIRTVKSFSKEAVEMNAYKQKMERVLSLAMTESLARGVFFGMAGLSGNLIALIVLYAGGMMVSSQSLSIGDLSAFLLYAAYIGVSLGGLSSFYSELNRGLGASSRLWEIIERNPEIRWRGGIEPEKDIRGEILFKGVRFSYPTRPDTPVLNDLTLYIPAGSITSVVGRSGSGKSTIGLLLLGLYNPKGGDITVDGIRISEYSPLWLRNRIGTVSQEPVLFSGTVRENILYGADRNAIISSHDIDKVLKEANAYDFVQNLPQGLDTIVGERGIMLSGGQKQRIAIARALIKDPKVLLLDEATSALDAESEHLVQEALERILKGRTVLTIAHRLSTIKNSDQIAVLDQGVIVELGNYEKLISIDNGVFKELVKHQTFQLV
ncbi:unnamed protein product [Nezara viridula]|uniref:ATP-binding cassette sub-family B member 10, mitochondrial n=1 Tax=Nezara viridula TaxID=85310 RepID=A0A9P0E5P0_NEZVI|nr:unnamed protein product [Nezara viridula]